MNIAGLLAKNWIFVRKDTDAPRIMFRNLAKQKIIVKLCH